MKTLLSILCLLSLTATAAEVRLTWDPSPSTGVTNYVVKAEQVTAQATNTAMVGVGTNLTARLDLQPGRWTFVAFAEMDGVRSDPSNTLIIEVPKPPAGLRTLSVDWVNLNALAAGTNWVPVPGAAFRVRLE